MTRVWVVAVSRSMAEPAPASKTSKLSRWSTFVTAAIALLALGLSIAGWVRPSHDGTSQAFTGQQINDAKASVCTAYKAVLQEVRNNLRLKMPAPESPIGTLAVATNVRLALYGGGGYLKDHVAMAPATPADLAKAVSSMGNTLEELAIGYMRAAPNFTGDSLRNDLDAQTAQVAEFCK
jgi:hypothetical protein